MCYRRVCCSLSLQYTQCSFGKYEISILYNPLGHRPHRRFRRDRYLSHDTCPTIVPHQIMRPQSHYRKKLQHKIAANRLCWPQRRYRGGLGGSVKLCCFDLDSCITCCPPTESVLVALTTTGSTISTCGLSISLVGFPPERNDRFCPVLDRGKACEI